MVTTNNDSLTESVGFKTTKKNKDLLKSLPGGTISDHLRQIVNEHIDDYIKKITGRKNKPLNNAKDQKIKSHKDIETLVDNLLSQHFSNNKH